MTEGKGGLLTLILAVPILALFIGVGIFAYNASATWTSADNQATVTALAAVCGSGIVVLGLMIAFIVGIPLAIRAYGESGRARREWAEPPMETPYQARPRPPPTRGQSPAAATSTTCPRPSRTPVSA